MFRQDGAILTRYPPLANAPPTLSPTSPVMSRIRDGVVSGDAAGISSVDGRQRLLTFARVGDYPLYVGTGIRGYGKLIIIKHNRTYLSVYAHNRDILVAEGQAVTLVATVQDETFTLTFQPG